MDRTLDRISDNFFRRFGYRLRLLSPLSSSNLDWVPLPVNTEDIRLVKHPQLDTYAYPIFHQGHLEVLVQILDLKEANPALENEITLFLAVTLEPLIQGLCEREYLSEWEMQMTREQDYGNVIPLKRRFVPTTELATESILDSTISMHLDHHVLLSGTEASIRDVCHELHTRSNRWLLITISAETEPYISLDSLQSLGPVTLFVPALENLSALGMSQLGHLAQYAPTAETPLILAGCQDRKILRELNWLHHCHFLGLAQSESKGAHQLSL